MKSFGCQPLYLNIYCAALGVIKRPDCVHVHILLPDIMLTGITTTRAWHVGLHMAQAVPQQSVHLYARSADL